MIIILIIMIIIIIITIIIYQKLHQKKIATLVLFYRQIQSWKCTRNDK